MMQLVYGGIAGLWLGLTLQWSRLNDPAELRSALSLRASSALKTALAFLGFGALLTAFLGWLAVLDVDLLIVTELHGGVILGGIIFGASAALCGRTPLTALSGIGGFHPVQSLCVAAGCAAGALLWPFVSDLFQPLRNLPPQMRETLFRVTLDEPFLFQGGFLGQGCVGAVLLALAMWIPVPRREEEPPPAEESVPEVAAEEPVVVTLEGEEPIVVDSEPEETKTPEEEPSEQEDTPEDEEITENEEDSPEDEN